MTRYFPDDPAVERVGRGLIDRSLPKAEWTHAAHFAATLWLLRHEPQPPLEVRMPALIRAYNQATGVANTDTDGYHETITLASIGAARAVLATHSPDRPLHEVVDALMATPLGRSDWLLAYWSRDRLFSVAARRAWIEPDLQPLAL
jgi:hypothetical protein